MYPGYTSASREPSRLEIAPHLIRQSRPSAVLLLSSQERPVLWDPLRPCHEAAPHWPRANTRREAGKVWCARLARTPTIEGFQSDVIPREGPARRRGGAQDDMRTACVVTCTAAAARSDGVVDSCDYSSQLAVEGENRSESERSGVVGGVTVASSRGQPRCKERLKVGHNRNWHWTMDRLIGIL